MTPIEQWTAVDQYLVDLLVGHDDVLDAVLQASVEAALPAIHVGANQGKLLQLLAQILGAKRILEIGTLGGYSSIWMARGMQADGKLVTLESDPAHAAVARANFDRAGLSKRIDLRVGRAIETLPQLLVEHAGPFELVFIDADKVSTAAYVAWALRLTRPGSLIVVDNVVRDGKVVEIDSDDDGVQGVRKALSMIANEPRLSATAWQTVGSKGYDGLAIARVIG